MRSCVASANSPRPIGQRWPLFYVALFGWALRVFQAPLATSFDKGYWIEGLYA
jgi:hypothetical protein